MLSKSKNLPFDLGMAKYLIYLEFFRFGFVQIAYASTGKCPPC